MREVNTMPRTNTPLHLHEEIMLLALRDKEGTVELGSMYGYALGGAILAELLLAGRISVEDGKRKLIDLVNDAAIGEPVIDDCLRKVGHREAARGAAKLGAAFRGAEESSPARGGGAL